MCNSWLTRLGIVADCVQQLVNKTVGIVADCALQLVNKTVCIVADCVQQLVNKTGYSSRLCATVG